jgi:uncharacterized protein
MREPAQIRMLPDGRRLHLHDGPIDLIIEADGPRSAVEHAYKAAATRFVTILDELCAELAVLRAQVLPNRPRPQSQIAQRMYNAVLQCATTGAGVQHAGPHVRTVSDLGSSPAYIAFEPSWHRHLCLCSSEPDALPSVCEGGLFITPMAAVAGAVAEAVLREMTNAADLHRAYVNNGGDIAIHLTPGQSFTVGMVERPESPSLFGSATIAAESGIRGIATSGWRGRSFSLGIADAVTVLSSTASQADAAATIIANAVDLPGHPAITRVPANQIAPDSDLLDLPVTRAVGPLPSHEIAQALHNGLRVAETLCTHGLIRAAALCLQGHVRLCCRDGLLRPSANTTQPQLVPRRSLQHA